MVKESPGTTETPADERAGLTLAGEGLSRSNILGLAATALVLLALMAVLFVRLQQANQAVSSIPSFPLIGHEAPDFTVGEVWNGAPGQTIHLADLKGKPVVLNFWASWCAPCKEEMPTLQAGYDKYRASGVVFIGLAFNDEQKNGQPFLTQYKISYPAGPDKDGQISIAYGVTGVPETVFIGRDGRVVSKTPGGVSVEQLDAGVQQLLK
jgi:cytochrome c biogenesis protein CcmG/thiol:disulfide interchange protein DsbE